VATAVPADSAPGLLDAESAAWLEGLSAGSPTRDASVGRLHQLLLRAATAELVRRAPRASLSGQEAADLAQQAADDAVMAILRRLPDFRGQSRFTTWAHKFALVEMSNKLGRHYRSTRGGVSWDAGQWEQLPHHVGVSPEAAAEAAELSAAVRRAIDTDLTDRQREIFVSLVVVGMPPNALARQLATDRNTIYKVMSDARRKIRAALVTDGYLPPRANRGAA
jgi:RNA polymerase sigma-70 factor (ECF subfamily)